MSITGLPQFQYISTKPTIGGDIRQTLTRFQPDGWFNAGASAQPNQYIRFNFRTDGFWDPKTMYINIDIDCSNMPANSVYQIDNSAQSIISHYIARHNNTELIRIHEYDELAAMLYDLHIGSEERDSRVSEGIGRNRASQRQMSTKGNQGTFQPNGIRENPGPPISWPNTWETQYDATWHQSVGIELGNSMNGRSFTNSTWRPWWATQPAYDDNDAIVNTLTLLEGGDVCSYLDMFGMEDNTGMDMGWLDDAQTRPGFTFNGAYWVPVNQLGLGRLNGEASVGTGEAYCSNTVLKPTIKSGLPVYERNTHLTFQIPLLCPIFGALADHGKLLPMRIFDGMQFEFLVNPFAFFVGGGGDLVPKTDPLYNAALYDPATYNYTLTEGNRFRWAITKFEIVVEMIYPTTQDTSTIYGNLDSSGFALDFRTWFLGPKNKYGGGTNLNTQIQINNGFTSMDILAFYFQPADYEIHSHARKHKRISNNLTSMQLRIGNDYFPTLPIQGHAGNIRPDFTSQNQKGNYSEFFVNTMKAFGKWLNTKDNGIINPTNYCLNTVGYNPDDNAVGNILTYAKNTLADMSLFWENQCVPRNIFAFDMEKFDILGGSVKSGWNTMDLRPFDLLIQNDNSPVTYDMCGNTLPTVGGVISNTLANTAFQRPYYMYIWMYYNARITWSPSSGWMSHGRT